jgi:hypothetical protein
VTPNHCRGQVTQLNVMTTQFLQYSSFPPFSPDFTSCSPLRICTSSQDDGRQHSGHLHTDAQRLYLNSEVLKRGTSGNLQLFNFRLLKNAVHVALQAQRLLVVTGEKGPFSKSSGVKGGHNHESPLLDYTICYTCWGLL